MKHSYIEDRGIFNVCSQFKLRCKTEDAEGNTCGDCRSCLFKTKLYDSTQWLMKASEASKRRFLTGVLVRCHNTEILENIRSILQVTLGKDFTYSRSRLKPSAAEDLCCWSSDRVPDKKHIEVEMMETWDWFGASPSWTQSNYLLGVLPLCDTNLLHKLGNLARVLLVRERQRFLHFPTIEVSEAAGDVTSASESLHSFHTDDHPHLDLLVRASSVYEPINPKFERKCNEPGTHLTSSPSSELIASQPERATTSEFEGVLHGTGLSEEQHASDTESICSDDPALMVVPRASKSLSGVSKYRDFIRGLPVHMAKRILGLLDKASFHSCQGVSQHWHYLTKEILEETEMKIMRENQVAVLQGSSSLGVNPVYAKIRDVLVPIREEETHIPHGCVIPKYRKDKGFESVYTVKTKTVQMEERNVYCGAYNILVLQESEDPSRVTHYAGGQMVALGSRDRRVRVLDVNTLKEVPLAIQGHAGSIRAVLICETRGLIISASYDLTIRCWDLRTGESSLLLHGHTGTVTCLDLQSSYLVSGARDCRVKVWNLQTGECYKRLKFKHQDPILSVKIDRALVISACERGLVKMWSMETASLIKTVCGHKGPVHCLFLDQWHILSGGPDGQVMAWSTNLDYKKCLMTYEHPMEVRTISFLYLRVITGCFDGKIRIFNFLTGDCLRVIKASTQQNPVLSLHTHDNRIVVNTRKSVLLFHFAKVCWDYQVTAERGLFRELTENPRGKQQRCPSTLRAECMAQTDSPNPTVCQRRNQPEKPCLHRHGRSVSAPSHRHTHMDQPVFQRPATWNGQQGRHRNRACMDLRSELTGKPGRATSPRGPVSGYSQDSYCRGSHTCRSTTTCSAQAERVMTLSERAVKDRMRRRGLHRPLTADQVLLRVNSAQQLQCGDQAGVNMELNARVRDAWSSPPPVVPLKELHPKASPPPTQKGEKLLQSPKPSTYSTYRGTTKIFTPLTSHALAMKPRRSLHSQQVCSSIAPSVVVRPQTALGIWKRPSQLQPDRRRPQTSCGTEQVMRKVSVFDAATGKDVQAPQQMFVMRRSSKHPGRHVDFEAQGKFLTSHNPLDPLREQGTFQLRTDTQLEQFIQKQTQQQQQTTQNRSNQERHLKTTVSLKLRGAP